MHSAKKPSLNGGRLLAFTSNFGIESRKRSLNVRNVFYENKVSGLQDSNISRWWRDIKELGGLSRSGDWSSQLIGSEIPDEATLALKFNEFLGSLTAHFRLLEPLSPVFAPVPAHLYVSKRTVYKTLRALKVKKSPGPELIPNIVWKEFAFELSPVLADIYNSSLEQGYVPAQLKQQLWFPSRSAALQCLYC